MTQENKFSAYKKQSQILAEAKMDSRPVKCECGAYYRVIWRSVYVGASLFESLSSFSG
jgi:hypothetical protein